MANDLDFCFPLPTFKGDISGAVKVIPAFPLKRIKHMVDVSMRSGVPTNDFNDLDELALRHFASNRSLESKFCRRSKERRPFAHILCFECRGCLSNKFRINPGCRGNLLNLCE